MKLLKYFPLFALLALFTLSCDPEPGDGQLKVVFELVKDGSPISLNENYSGDQVTAMRFEKLKFFISDLKLSGYQSTLRGVEIVDFESDRVSFTFNTIQEGTYTGLNYSLGLSEDINASNPLDFPTGDPLSASWAMYWSWATKYRFILMEGRAAPDGQIDGQGDDFFIAMHPGADGFMQNVTLNKSIAIEEGKTKTVTIQIDVDDMFDGPGGLIDLPNENQTHTTPEDRDIALKYMQNFAAAMSVK